MLPSYSSPFNVEHKAVKGLIFDGPVVVQEKVDGSQISFGIVNGELQVRSKGAFVHLECEASHMFHKAVKSIVERKDKLVPGYIYRGEYLSKPKHNVLAYDRTPLGNIVLFDIEDLNQGDEVYLAQNIVGGIARELGFDYAPVYHYGVLDDHRDLAQFMGNISILGGQRIEGVVVKNYNKFTPDKKIMMAKLVSGDFKEVHRAEWKSANPTPTDIKNTIVQMYKTPARWNKAIQHLREAGTLTDSPKDIGPLINEVMADIEKECLEEIKDMLYAHFAKDIKRGVVYGLPEWYKEKLNGPSSTESQNLCPSTDDSIGVQTGTEPDSSNGSES